MTVEQTEQKIQNPFVEATEEEIAEEAVRE